MIDHAIHRRKSRDASGNASGMKKLRQKTLLGSLTSEAGSPLTRPRASINTSGKPHSPRKTKKRHVSDSSERSDTRLEPVTPTAKPEEGDRSESPMPSRVKRRRMLVVKSDNDGEDTPSSSSKVVSALRRRRPRGRALAAPESSESSDQRYSVDKAKDEELISEDDLSDEVDEHCIIESRLRTRNKKTVFQRNLERLKRKKLGKPMSPSDSSNEESENSSKEERLKLLKGSKLASKGAESSTRDESDDSSSFIVEDDNQAVAAQLPSEFSMRSHDDLSNQFKVIFQLFVHVAVRTSVERHTFMSEQVNAQDYFSFPLKMTRRKLAGLRDSLVASSIWRPKFREALDRYPIFECVPLASPVSLCDACHLTGRLSTLLGRLGGVSYNKVGFIKNMASDSEEENSGDSVTQLRKSQFDFFEFNLGQFCARRVRVYHALSHWEYHLFDAICSEIDDLRAVKVEDGYVRVAFSGGKQPPSDLTDADGICEWLDERGIIDREWHGMRAIIDSAHRLESLKGEEGQ